MDEHELTICIGVKCVFARSGSGRGFAFGLPRSLILVSLASALDWRSNAVLRSSLHFFFSSSDRNRCLLC